jgi:hypothetical protein
MLRRHRFEKCLKVLELPLQRALTTEDVQFDAGREVISLLDFPRFKGASWEHNDIVVYVPDQNTTAVMKLSDKRFNPLYERLSSITMGVDPFIGTTLKISQARLNLVFNRIRCGSATSIDIGSFKRFEYFQELIKSCRGSFRSPTYMAAAVMGNISLDLSRCVIARYENYYCLMEFFQSQARVKSVVREKDWSHSFVFDFEGIPCRGLMLRDSLFDVSAEPERIPANDKVDVLGFVTYGRTSLQAFGTRIHVLALHQRPSTISTTIRSDDIESDLPTINDVEDELIGLELRKERRIYLSRKWSGATRSPNEVTLIKIYDPLILGDLARLLSTQNVTVQDLFNWENGGKPLLLLWSRGGRRSSNLMEELRSALKFILGMRTEIKLPRHILNKEEGDPHTD